MLKYTLINMLYATANYLSSAQLAQAMTYMIYSIDIYCRPDNSSTCESCHTFICIFSVYNE